MRMQHADYPIAALLHLSVAFIAALLQACHKATHLQEMLAGSTFNSGSC